MDHELKKAFGVYTSRDAIAHLRETYQGKREAALEGQNVMAHCQGDLSGPFPIDLYQAPLRINAGRKDRQRGPKL